MARLISAVASLSRRSTSSITMWESGQSQTGVCFRSSANKSGYLHTRWIGYVIVSWRTVMLCLRSFTLTSRSPTVIAFFDLPCWTL